MRINTLNAVTIHDLDDRGCLAFDLIDILRLYESEVRASAWDCRNLSCVLKPSATSSISEVEQNHEALSGEGLLGFAADLQQLIDGELLGTFKGESEPWLVIVAEDSTYYVVLGRSQDLLDRARQHFKDVRESKQWADSYDIGRTGSLR